MSPARPHPLRRLTAAATATAAGLALAVAGGPAPAGAATTSAATARVSVTSTGAQVPAGVLPVTAVDEEGRLVAFGGPGAYAPEDTNGKSDVYVRDRTTGTTTRVSLTDDEKQLNGTATLCGASADLRHVAFWASATNLPGGTTGQVYVRDRIAGTTALVSIGAGGQASAKGATSGILGSQRGDVSADGRYVVFASEGTNLVASDTNGVSDVFRRDRTASTTVRLSLADDEGQLAGFGSTDPQMSDDGSKVLFTTRAVVGFGDTNDATDVFVRYVPTSGTSPSAPAAGTCTPRRGAPRSRPSPGTGAPSPSSPRRRPSSRAGATTTGRPPTCSSVRSSGSGSGRRSPRPSRRATPPRRLPRCRPTAATSPSPRRRRTCGRWRATTARTPSCATSTSG